MDEPLDELIEKSLTSLGRYLAKKRWAKATPAERKAQGKLLAAGRRKKNRRKR